MSGRLTREQIRREHAERLLRTTPPERLRVLRLLAERFGYWQHVDWSRMDDPTPPPEIRCDGCGALLSWRGELCQACFPRFALSNAEWRAAMALQTAVADLGTERRLREKRASEYMQDNPQGSRCSRCGVIVAEASDPEAVLCWRCVQLLAELERRGYWHWREPHRICPDCNGERPKGAVRCPKCARRRRLTLDRLRKRKIG